MRAAHARELGVGRLSQLAPLSPGLMHGAIDGDAMRRTSHRVDSLGLAPARVAREFLGGLRGNP